MYAAYDFFLLFSLFLHRLLLKASFVCAVSQKHALRLLVIDKRYDVVRLVSSHFVFRLSLLSLRCRCTHPFITKDVLFFVCLFSSLSLLPEHDFRLLSVTFMHPT